MSTDIPLFELTRPSSSLSRSLVAAFRQHGFLYVRASPFFSAPLIDRAFSLSQTFFSLQDGTKSQYRMQANNRGWTSLLSEVLDPSLRTQGDPKEAFNFGEFDPNGKAQQPLPEVFAAAEAILAEFQLQCWELCTKLLECIAEGLEIENEGVDHKGGAWFSSRHTPASGDAGSGTILRMLHYPPSPSETRHSEPPIIAGAHSDYGSMTLLFRQPGDAGLQILTTEGGWSPVPAVPRGAEADEVPPVLVNVGDLLSYWTGGLLKSTMHRVVGRVSGERANGATSEADAKAGHRYSMAFFCHPRRDTLLEPVPSQIVREHMQRTGEQRRDVNRKAITADEHLQRRLTATYGPME